MKESRIRSISMESIRGLLDIRRIHRILSAEIKVVWCVIIIIKE